MTLESTDFAPLVTALTDNAPVIVGLIVSLAAITYVIRLVKRYAR